MLVELGELGDAESLSELIFRINFVELAFRLSTLALNSLFKI
jgi:hypothetical protein